MSEVIIVSPSTTTPGGLAGLGHRRGEESNDPLGLCRGWLPGVFGWHFSQVELIQDLLQEFAILWFAEVECQLVETPFPLLLLGTVAAQAILLQERADYGREIFLGCAQRCRQ